MGCVEVELMQFSRFVAQYVSDGGKKYYSAEQLSSLSGHVMLDKPARKVIGYARVSSHDQKADLVRQQDLLTSYLTARFGFNYLKQICDFHNVEIVIVSSELNDKSLEIELAEDIISIIHSFSGRLYGLRKNLKQRLERELSNDEDTTG